MVDKVPSVAAPGGRPESAQGASSDSGAPTFTDSLTPSGLEIRYYPENKDLKIKRHYELRDINIADSLRTPLTEWKTVPSVSTILDVLDKPLSWWGQRVGVEGLITLINRGLATAMTPVDEIAGNKQKKIKGLLSIHKLSVNHVRDSAGDRGTTVHAAFETWCNTQILPDPEMYTEEERGYVLGLLKFLRDVEPEPQAAEVMVGSLEHGYAGRYDARVYVPRKCEVVYKHTPKRGDHRAVLKPSTLLVDLKTSSGIYVSHELQLAGYELASIEDGYGPSDARGIIHVMPDGNYEFFRARAEPDDFLAVLAAYNAIEKFKKKDR